MSKKLSKKDRAIIDNLDRMMAGQVPHSPSGFLEEKLWQALKLYETNERKRAGEQESLSQLMSDISHQLKTPLSALSLHLELAGDEALDATERMAALTECKEQAEKIRFLSDAMFKVARLETGLIAVQKIPEDIIAALDEAVRAVEPSARAKGLVLVKRLPGTPVVIPHDPLWTKEAFVNILGNAVKYTNSGAITVSAEQGAIYTRIDIEDTGIGLSPDEYTKVFSRFYRARAAGTERVEGTGLGLPIAREILRRQDGNITVASVIGKGSVFSVFLQNC